MQKNIIKTDTGIKINFLGSIEKQKIVTMVQNCSNGKCECMSDETKSKIKNMKVNGVDGNIELNLEGNISKEEIQKALTNSTLLN